MSQRLVIRKNDTVQQESMEELPHAGRSKLDNDLSRNYLSVPVQGRSELVNEDRFTERDEYRTAEKH
jgi:hypothetical protein